MLLLLLLCVCVRVCVIVHGSMSIVYGICKLTGIISYVIVVVQCTNVDVFYHVFIPCPSVLPIVDYVVKCAG